MIPCTCGTCCAARYASSCVCNPFSIIGFLVSFASHGSVFFHVSFGSVPKNNDCPIPPPPLSFAPPASLMSLSRSSTMSVIFPFTRHGGIERQADKLYRIELVDSCQHVLG